jgi:glutathione S-transferase
MATTIPDRLTLISHKLCPYVQRAVIALEELGVEYRRIDIDLDNPPEWFGRLSPLGKVPILLIDDDTVLFESAVIAEYINEITGGGMLAADPLDRACERAWIEFASATLDSIGALYSAPGEKSYARAASQLATKWRQLEQNIGDGAFFGGEKFSLVDAAFAPVFRYLDLFEQLVDDDFLGDFPRISQWRAALAARDSVIGAVSPDYPTLLAEFLARRNSWLGTRAKSFLADRLAA